MAGKTSAGILLYSKRNELELLLVHPGGPFFKKKDEGAWSIPKGEYEDGEDPAKAAIREFQEELGIALESAGTYLGQIKQKGGKIVHSWALPCDDARRALIENIDIPGVCEKFELEWPPKSGKKTLFPEIDQALFFDLQTARMKINAAQLPFIDSLLEHLKTNGA